MLAPKDFLNATRNHFQLDPQGSALTVQTVYEPPNPVTEAALCDWIADARAGRIPPGSSVVFIHTGGIGNLFDQPDVFVSRLINNAISA